MRKKIVILANNMIDEEEREIFQSEIPYDVGNGSIVNEDGIEVPLDEIWVDFEVKIIET